MDLKINIDCEGVSLERALEQMTDTWIENGEYSEQTVTDLRDACKKLLASKSPNSREPGEAPQICPNCQTSTKVMVWANQPEKGYYCLACKYEW